MRKLLVTLIMMISSVSAYANANKIIDVILTHEGKEVEGNGISRYGITLQTLKDYKVDPNKDGKINTKDVYSIKENTARKIYSMLYIDTFPNKKSVLVEKILMPVSFDTSVNMGVYHGNKLLVNATNWKIARYKLEGKAVKYVTKNNVFEFLNTQNEQTLKEINNVLINLRNNRYVRLSNGSKNLHKYLRGWLKRSNSFRYEL